MLVESLDDHKRISGLTDVYRAPNRLDGGTSGKK